MSQNTHSVDLQSPGSAYETRLPSPRGLTRFVTSPVLIVNDESRHGEVNRNSVDTNVHAVNAAGLVGKQSVAQEATPESKKGSNWDKVKSKKKYGFPWGKKEAGPREGSKGDHDPVIVEDVTTHFEMPRSEPSKVEKTEHDSSAYSSVRNSSDKDKLGIANPEETASKRRGSVFKSMPFKGLGHSHQKTEHESTAETIASPNQKHTQSDHVSFTQEGTPKPVPISKKQTPTPENTAKPVPISKKQTPTPEDKSEPKGSPNESSQERSIQSTGNTTTQSTNVALPQSYSSLGSSRNRSPSPNPLSPTQENQTNHAADNPYTNKRNSSGIPIEIDGEPYQSTDSGEESDNLRGEEETNPQKERKSTTQLLEDQRKFIQDTVVSQMTELSKDIAEAEQSILLIKDTVGMVEQNSEKLKKVQDLLPKLNSALGALERQQLEIKGRVSAIERNLDNAIQLNQIAVDASKANMKKVDEVMAVLEKRLDKLYGYVQTATTQGSNSTIGYTILGWIFGLFSYILNGASLLKGLFQQQKKRGETPSARKTDTSNDYSGGDATMYKPTNSVQTLQSGRTETPSERKKSIIFEHPLISGSVSDLSKETRYSSPTQDSASSLEIKARASSDKTPRLRHSSFTKSGKSGVEGEAG